MSPQSQDIDRAESDSSQVTADVASNMNHSETTYMYIRTHGETSYIYTSNMNHSETSYIPNSLQTAQTSQHMLAPDDYNYDYSAYDDYNYDYSVYD